MTFAKLQYLTTESKFDSFNMQTILLFNYEILVMKCYDTVMYFVHVTPPF